MQGVENDPRKAYADEAGKYYFSSESFDKYLT
jgi:hypothetical protein